MMQSCFFPVILFLFPPLVTLGIGFWIFANASHLPKKYSPWGRLIGALMMIVAIAGLIFFGSQILGYRSTCPRKSPMPPPGAMKDIKPEEWEKFNVIPPEHPSDVVPNP